MKKVLQTIIIALLMTPFFVFAQTPYTVKIDVESNPRSPSFGDSFYVFITSSAINLKGLNTDWFINDKKVDSGLGKTDILVDSNFWGNNIEIRAETETPYGTVVSEKTFNLIGIEIIWEAETYVPAFYKGKALFSYRSPINAVALINSNNSTVSFTGNDSLNYKWSVNGKYDPGISGFGKNITQINTPLISPKNITISVEISDINSNVLGKSGVSILENTPQIIFYEDDPLLGERLDLAISDSFVFKNEEMTIKAEPYYFSILDLDYGYVETSWSANNKSLGIENGIRRVTFGNSGGVAKVSFSIQNTRRIIQSAVKNILLKDE